MDNSSREGRNERIFSGNDFKFEQLRNLSSFRFGAMGVPLLKDTKLGQLPIARDSNFGNNSNGKNSISNCSHAPISSLVKEGK